MNPQVHRFYRTFADEQAPIRLYHEVIALHEIPWMEWEEISKKAPLLPRGWYELSKLEVSDRLEFISEFWLASLTYVPHVHVFLERFFQQLDDVGVYLTKMRFDSPFESEIVYSLKDGSCFYHGSPPCSASEIEQLTLQYEGILPPDYLSFLKIHDGFSKHTDTGIIRTKYLQEAYQQIQRELEQYNREMAPKTRLIEPTALIPFYESYGQPAYQCFFSAWTPTQFVGNVYYSTLEKTISDISNRNTWQDNLAFPTFLDWLVFYLERVE